MAPRRKNYSTTYRPERPPVLLGVLRVDTPSATGELLQDHRPLGEAARMPKEWHVHRA